MQSFYEKYIDQIWKYLLTKKNIEDDMQINLRFWVSVLIIVFTLIIGCTSNSPKLSIGQSATDGKDNYQRITLNGATYLSQPYINRDPDLDEEWHNWDWIVLNISITNLRIEKTVNVGSFELYDTTRSRSGLYTQPTCFSYNRLELSTLHSNDLIKHGETKTGNIGCAIPPDLKYPLTLEYDFDTGYSIPLYSIPKPAGGNYATMPKGNGGLPGSGAARPRI